MSRGSIVMVGMPDSGKTNYLAAFWDALRSGKGALFFTTPPNDLRYVEGALAFQSQGEFAPRSDKNIEESRKDFTVGVKLKANPERSPVDIVVPDITGELWKDAVETTEIPAEWLNELRNARGALLFTRDRSPFNTASLDWVTAARLLSSIPTSDHDKKMSDATPTQIALCELLRFLEYALPRSHNGKKPRVAIVVSAWDLLDSMTVEAGPAGYIQKEYPLFAGRLRDASNVDVTVFGVSSVGGDFTDPEFKERYLKGETSGYVCQGAGATRTIEKDITLPIAWVMDETGS